MKIPDMDAARLQAAVEGGLDAIDHVLRSVQPGVFNLAVRMLGNREDAGDATQEILLKVVTHLATFRREAAFGTWVYSIARNHLLTAATRSRESPTVSLEAMAERLQAGLDYGATLAHARGEVTLSPEDKLAARQVALGCTQNMLMTLDREQRLAYLLDAVFGLTSEQAARVLAIAPAAYRKRVSRVRASLDPFVRKTCGLVQPAAACRCERQLPAMRHQQGDAGAPKVFKLLAVGHDELLEAERHLDAMLRMSDAAALFRAHPDYRAPESMIAAIRSVLLAEGYWSDQERRPLQ